MVKIRRFNKTEIWAHGINSVGLIALLVTGALLFFHRWLPGGREWYEQLIELHLYAAGVYLGGPIMAWLIGDTVSWWKWIRDGMKLQRGDFRWLMLAPVQLLGFQVELPPQGRFNIGQRLNMWLQLLGKLGFFVTGLIIVLSPGQLYLVLVHVALAALVTVGLAGHLFMAVINSDTRREIKGMITGWVDAEWAKRHYELWFKQLDAGRFKENGPAAPDSSETQNPPGPRENQ